jgi:hypothetical protein
MDHRSFPPVDLDLEGVQLIELIADFHGMASRLHRIHPPLRLKDLGQGLPLNVLHGHEIAAIDLARVINLEEARVYFVELLLDQGAPALRFQDDLRPGVGGLFDDFQDGVAVINRVERQVDIGHTPAELADDFVSAKLLDLQHSP